MPIPMPIPMPTPMPTPNEPVDEPLDAPMPTAPTSPRVMRALGITAVIAVAVHLCVLYWPTVTVAGPVTWTDKVVHVLVFAVPTVLVARFTGRLGTTALVFGAHAVISELVQHVFLPHRSGDPWDSVADLVGVGLATVLVARAGRGRVVGRALER